MAKNWKHEYEDDLYDDYDYDDEYDDYGDGDYGGSCAGTPDHHHHEAHAGTAHGGGAHGAGAHAGAGTPGADDGAGDASAYFQKRAEREASAAKIVTPRAAAAIDVPASASGALHVQGPPIGGVAGYRGVEPADWLDPDCWRGVMGHLAVQDVFRLTNTCASLKQLLLLLWTEDPPLLDKPFAQLGWHVPASLKAHPGFSPCHFLLERRPRATAMYRHVRWVAKTRKRADIDLSATSVVRLADRGGKLFVLSTVAPFAVTGVLVAVDLDSGAVVLRGGEANGVVMDRPYVFRCQDTAPLDDGSDASCPGHPAGATRCLLAQGKTCRVFTLGPADATSHAGDAGDAGGGFNVFTSSFPSAVTDACFLGHRGTVVVCCADGLVQTMRVGQAGASGARDGGDAGHAGASADAAGPAGASSTPLQTLQTLQAARSTHVFRALAVHGHSKVLAVGETCLKLWDTRAPRETARTGHGAATAAKAKAAFTYKFPAASSGLRGGRNALCIGDTMFGCYHAGTAAFYIWRKPGAGAAGTPQQRVPCIVSAPVWAVLHFDEDMAIVVLPRLPSAPLVTQQLDMRLARGGSGDHGTVTPQQHQQHHSTSAIAVNSGGGGGDAVALPPAALDMSARLHCQLVDEERASKHRSPLSALNPVYLEPTNGVAKLSRGSRHYGITEHPDGHVSGNVHECIAVGAGKIVLATQPGVANVYDRHHTQLPPPARTTQQEDHTRAFMRLASHTPGAARPEIPANGPAHAGTRARLAHTAHRLAGSRAPHVALGDAWNFTAQAGFYQYANPVHHEVTLECGVVPMESVVSIAISDTRQQVFGVCATRGSIVDGREPRSGVELVTWSLAEREVMQEISRQPFHRQHQQATTSSSAKSSAGSVGARQHAPDPEVQEAVRHANQAAKIAARQQKKKALNQARKSVGRSTAKARRNDRSSKHT